MKNEQEKKKCLLREILYTSADCKSWAKFVPFSTFYNIPPPQRKKKMGRRFANKKIN